MEACFAVCDCVVDVLRSSIIKLRISNVTLTGRARVEGTSWHCLEDILDAMMLWGLACHYFSLVFLLTEISSGIEN